ncbi:hypothetical protein [Galbibacter sp. BG1]
MNKKKITLIGGKQTGKVAISAMMMGDVIEKGKKVKANLFPAGNFKKKL